MNEKSSRARDVTGEFTSGYTDWDDLPHLESQFSNKERKRIWSNIEKIWNLLVPEFKKATGIQLPTFSKDMFSWVNFSHIYQNSSPSATHNPVSGAVQLSLYSLHPENIDRLAHDLAHEMAYAISRRVLLLDESEVIPVRSGLSFIKNALTSYVGESNSHSKVRNYYHIGWAGTPFDEAVVEIFSSKILKRVKDKIAGLENIEVNAVTYVEERRIFNALVQNIVLAWNIPELRQNTDYRVRSSRRREGESWQYRIKKLQSDLGWGDTITSDQVVHLFEQALHQKNGLTKIARLLNTVFGDSAFQELWRGSKHEATDQKKRLFSIMEGV